MLPACSTSRPFDVSGVAEHRGSRDFPQFVGFSLAVIGWPFWVDCDRDRRPGGHFGGLLRRACRWLILLVGVRRALFWTAATGCGMLMRRKRRKWWRLGQVGLRSRQ